MPVPERSPVSATGSSYPFGGRTGGGRRQAVGGRHAVAPMADGLSDVQYRFSDNSHFWGATSSHRGPAADSGRRDGRPLTLGAAVPAPFSSHTRASQSRSANADIPLPSPRSSSCPKGSL